MCFFIAAVFLLGALLAGAFIGPDPSHSQGLMTDFCALHKGGWHSIAYKCSDQIFPVPLPVFSSEREISYRRLGSLPRMPSVVQGTIPARRTM
jgi:hypothetical protein